MQLKGVLVAIAVLVALAIGMRLAIADDAAPIETQIVAANLPCLNQACSWIGVPARALDAVNETNKDLARENGELRARLETAGKTCATLHVVPDRKT